MTRKLFVLGIILAFAFVLYAQDDKTVKINGYLLDNACSASEKAEKLEERAKNHKTSCALMPNCKGGGYSVYSDAKLYKFDEAGNKSAVELLENTETKSGVQVAVEGTMEGETLHVTKLTEI